jgi:hypothetical protein
MRRRTITCSGLAIFREGKEVLPPIRPDDTDIFKQIREMEDPVRQGFRDRPRCCQKTKTFQENSAEVAVAAFVHREQESPFMNGSRGGGEIRNCLRSSHLQLMLPLGTARAYRAPMQSGAGGCTRTA